MVAESRSTPTLAIFTRAPELGKVKTRLARAVGERAAFDAHQMLQRRSIEVATASGFPAEIWLDGNLDALPIQQLAIFPQCAGDLGARMLHTIAHITARGHPAIIIGSDCPVLDVNYLRDAVRALDSGIDVVVGPVEDGGYVLIGMAQPQPALFLDMTWSTRTVLSETLERAAAAGLTTTVLDELWDVDNVADWQRWQSLTKALTPNQRPSRG